MVFLTTYLIAQKGPNMFHEKEKVNTAYNNKKFSYYEAIDISSYKINPVDGKERTLAGLPKDALVDMNTANGRRWVVLKEKTLLRWKNGVPYAMDTCGNKIFAIFYPEQKKNSIQNSFNTKQSEETEKNVQTTKSEEISNNISDVSVSDTSKNPHNHSAINNCGSNSGSRQFFATSGVVFYPYYYSNSYNTGYSFRYSSTRSRSIYRTRLRR